MIGVLNLSLIQPSPSTFPGHPGEACCLQPDGRETIKEPLGPDPRPASFRPLVCLSTHYCFPALPSKAPVFIETSALLASCRREYVGARINTGRLASPPEPQPAAGPASQSRGPLPSLFHPLAGAAGGLARVQQPLGPLSYAL